MSEETFCEKCEAYNKHVAQPNNLPLRDTFYTDLFCPNCPQKKSQNFDTQLKEVNKKTRH